MSLSLYSSTNKIPLEISWMHDTFMGVTQKGHGFWDNLNRFRCSWKVVSILLLLVIASLVWLFFPSFFGCTSISSFSWGPRAN